MKNTLLIFLLLTFNYITAESQSQPIHQKKTFVSPDNKIYFNKSLPVYFYISTSADPNAPKYLLKSETTPQYSNPMYFDTEGRNTLRSPSAVDTVTKEVIMPKMDILYQIYIDSKSPSTRIEFNPKKTTLIKEIHYLSDSLTIFCKASDETSGVENTYISIDNAPFQIVKEPLVIDKEKEYHIAYYSVDNTGNTEPLKEIKFSVDKTPPLSKLQITGQNSEGILSGSSYIELIAEDKNSGLKGIYVSIDSGAFKPYLGKINTSLLTQGEHKISFYSTDKVNNTEKTNTYPFYVDKTPPQVIEEIMGKTFVANGKEYSAGTSKLKITAIDNKAGVSEIYYSINNSAYVKYEKPIVLSGYKGNLLVTSYAVDNVGNRSLSNIANSRKNAISYIDLGAPWIGHSIKGPSFTNLDTTYINHKTSIILEAKDTESGINRIEYQTDTSDLKVYSGPITLSNEGYHYISVFGYDNTENLTRQSFSVVVDTVGPEIYERFSSPAIATIELSGKKHEQYSASTVIFLSATDAKSGFESIQYSLNNAPFQPYTRDIRGFSSGKTNYVRVRASDKLGNTTEKLIEFHIK